MFVRKDKIKASVVFGLVIAQLAVILGSWLYSAAFPESSVRAILSDSGIRWFFGTFVANLASPLLVYIILLDFAVGSCVYSGMWRVIASFFCRSHNSEPIKLGSLLAPLVTVVLEVAVVLALTVPRHAILLSATGSLFPSSFSVSLVAILAFLLFTASIVFGLFSGTLHNYREVIHCCVRGGSNLKFILAIYVLAMELWKMIEYVINV